MNLAQKLQEIVKKNNNTENNSVFVSLRKRVIREVTLAAELTKEHVHIKLVGDGERYWVSEILKYLNSEDLRAITYSATDSSVTIKVSWYK